MKVILQQIETGFFVGATAPLVVEEADAQVFRGCMEAMDYCVAEGIRDAEVLLRFSDSREVILKFSDPRYDRRFRAASDPEIERRAREFASRAERLARLHGEMRERLSHAVRTVAEIKSIATANQGVLDPRPDCSGIQSGIVGIVDTVREIR